jgi:hypothetical protein
LSIGFENLFSKIGNTIDFEVVALVAGSSIEGNIYIESRSTAGLCK